MAAARRAYWKGYLKLSLVTAPVALYPASSQAEKTHFHQINRKTGNRLRQQMVDEKTGKVVDKDDKSRGYEVSKGKYVEIEPDEIKAIQVESTHTIDIAKFVPADEIDRRYYDNAYYIVRDLALEQGDQETEPLRGQAAGHDVGAQKLQAYGQRDATLCGTTALQDGVATAARGRLGARDKVRRLPHAASR